MTHRRYGAASVRVRRRALPQRPLCSPGLSARKSRASAGRVSAKYAPSSQISVVQMFESS